MGRHDQLQDFHNFDFDTQDFKAWLTTVEVMSPDAATMQKLRARWYKRVIDKNFDLAWLDGAAPKPAASARSSSFQPGSTTPTSRATGSSTDAGPAPQQTSSKAAPPPPTGAGASSSVDAVQQRRLALYYAALLVLAIVHMVPFMPKVSRVAYRTFLQLTVIGQVYKLVIRFGLPKLRPFSWPRLQQGLTLIVPTDDFHFLVVGVAFVSYAPLFWIMVPIVLASAKGLLNYCHTYQAGQGWWLKYGRPLHGLMLKYQHQLQMYSAQAEVAAGPALLFSLIMPQRNFLLTFAYWNLLKMRYHISESAGLHRQVWAQVDRQTAPFRQRIPMLQKAVDYAAKWFLSTR